MKTLYFVFSSIFQRKQLKIFQLAEKENMEQEFQSSPLQKHGADMKMLDEV